MHMNNKDPYIEHLESISNYLNYDELSEEVIDDSEFEDALSELDEDTENE
jgi:hypothetical protein